MKEIVLSATSLKLYDECKRCFWDQMHDIKRPATVFPSITNGLDITMKKFFDDLRTEKNSIDILPEDTKLFNDQEQLDIWRNWRKGLNYHYMHGDNIYRLTGSIDDLLVSKKDGKFVLIDFKTRGYPPKDDTWKYYSSQLDIYYFLLRREGFDVHDVGYLMFVHPGEVSQYSAEHMSVDFYGTYQAVKLDGKSVLKRLEDVVTLIEGDRPEPTESCGFCKWEKQRFDAYGQA